HVCQESETAHVDPDNRRLRTSRLAGDPQHCPVTAEDHEQIDLPSEAGYVRAGGTLYSGQTRRGRIADRSSGGGLDEGHGVLDKAATGGLFRIRNQADSVDFFS